MDYLTIENFLSLITMLGLEIVLGLDNLLFIVIAVHNLETTLRDKARSLGLVFAMILRVFILYIAFYFKNITKPLFSVLNIPFSASSILMLLGGGFLLIKGINELYDLKKNIDKHKIYVVKNDFSAVVFQIILIDLILSFDSVIAAVSITEFMSLALISMLITICLMFFLSRKLGKFIYKYKSFRVLALSVISLLGASLILSAFGAYISKSSLYLTIFFAITFEIIRIFITENITNEKKLT